MASLNRVFLIGNLTRDPEVRYLPSGSAVTDLRMAVNRQYRTQDGQDREETVFLTVSVFGKQAEACGQYLRKGRPLFVEGRLKLDEWERDGQKQSRLGVVAERVQFLGSGGGGGGGGAERAETPRAPARDSAPPPPAANPPAGEPPAGDSDDLPF